ncbi:MAG TPA: hypothetical protein VMB22_02580 [Verrucomicrobiae bacterium]|nr:hypothetical protein [Verrucomicrobiae bacterium]
MKTKRLTDGMLVFVCLAALCFSTLNLSAQSAVTLDINTNDAGRLIPPDFCGLSYELKLVLTNPATAKHYFSPKNKPLINVFKTLGIKQLRVGGNTAERAGVAIPDHADIDSFFAFVKTAGVKAIYTVRMESNSPIAAAEVAKYVMDKYKPLVSCLTIGNEPDKAWKYPAYLADWKKFAATILQSVPDAKFCGPSATQKHVEWAGDFANDIGGSNYLAYVTQHFYPMGGGAAVSNATKAVAGRERLLSPEMYSVYQKFYDVFGPTVKAKGVGFRLEEGNSYSGGGAVGVSDTYAASLWIVDYLYWWAEHDALGLNFHTGEKVMRGLPGPDRPNVYTAFTTAPDGYTMLPTSYGMKLFNLGSQGRLVPVNIVSNADNVNLAAYATLTNKTLCVTVINKGFGATAPAANVTINSGMPSARASVIYMSVTNDDITADSGITIGGAGIKDNGTWSGKWKTLPSADKNGSLTVPLSPAAAAVIKLQGR